MEILTTAEVAALAGVGTSAVKRWADAGILPCVKTAGGHRRFERAAVEKLIREGAAGAIAERGADFAPTRQGEDSDVTRWLDALLDDVDGRDVEAMLLDERSARGSWYEVADFLGYVLVGLGARWARQEISVLEEHVASERLMRGLVRVSTALPFTRTAPIALLVAGAGDDHTLGLSLVELCMRESGWRTRWAGRRTPDADVVAVIERGEIDMVALSASATATDRRALARQLAAVGRACATRGVEMVIGGGGAWPARPTLARRFDDFATFHRALAVHRRGRTR